MDHEESGACLDRNQVNTTAWYYESYDVTTNKLEQAFYKDLRLLTSKSESKSFVMFHGEMLDNISMRKDKNTFFAAARLFWPEGCF